MHLRNGHMSLSPSDVTAYLACRHLTALSIEAAHGRLRRPDAVNEQAELVFRKGLEHERAYLDTLKGQGLSVAEIELGPELDWERGAMDTLTALEEGVDVVYQGVLMDDRWRGQADFLVRVNGRTDLGGWGYEALDTKLARHAKPAYVLQLCFYSQELERIQGVAPRWIHVLLGNGERESHAPRAFAAYYRRVCDRLERFVDAPPETAPYPCGQCDMCDFRPVCEERWDAVDHLCRVAGISRRQIERLEADGVGTLAALAAANLDERPQGIAEATFAKLHGQARLQARARATGVDEHELLPPEPGTGLALLPEPSHGDLFFDFEGNPFFDAEGSLEYLWGISDRGDRFETLWASSRDEERAAFEQFVDLVHARLAEHPDLHVYHYAQYEIIALRRMMGRYGTREAELDDLLRRQVFVDLYRVVKGGLRISRRGYGLKEIEHLLGFGREAEIRDGGTSIVEFERWMLDREDTSILDGIAAYNREDCIATRVLADWLLERRAEALTTFGSFPLRPEPEPPKPAPPEKAERAALRHHLIARGDDALALAGELLDYHDRERKPAWWAMFDKADMTDEQLLEDREAIAGLEQTRAKRPDKRSHVYTFTYPPQEQKIGRTPIAKDTLRTAGEVVAHDPDARRLDLRRGPSLADVPLPSALLPGRPYDTPHQEDALMRIGRSLLAGDGRYPAIESVLRRTPFPHDVQTNDPEALTALLLSLDGRHLVMQGPPGSGKTWLSGRLVVRLVAAGKRVGVASTSHRAIHKLLDEALAGAAEVGLELRGRKKASEGNPESAYPGGTIENVYDDADCHDCDLVGGTAWLFADGRHDGALDYLFVDEAGQVSLADALAMATCARNVVLVGDPQQLAQVLQGTHPEGAGRSVLEHLLDGHATVPPDRGVFLEKTYRLHPHLCEYISEEFYEGRLRADHTTSLRTTPFGTGLRYVAVDHDGNRQDAPEEVDAVVREVARLEGAGVPLAGIKVVSPYNAQVERLRAALPGAVEVGTVDKFQGQQCRVVLYSMASSSGEDVPRGLEFLFSRNRLNVAISRAECLAYLVCSPRLLEVDCRTIEHMRLANALCRFVELATAT